ncbi:MAG: PAS domain S-box protein [Elusimicrobiota bacterium]
MQTNDDDALVGTAIIKEPDLVLKGNVQLLRDMFTHFTDAMLVTDLKGRIVEVNPAFLRLFGYSRGEIVGRSIDTLSADPSLERDRVEHYRAVAEHGVWKGEITRTAKDGSNVVLLLTIVPIYERQRPAGYLYTGIDITRSKKIEHELSQARDLARLGELIISVVHEFKNPLQKLRSSVALLMEQMRPRGRHSRTIIRSLEESVNALNNLFSDLRDFSRPVRLAARKTSVSGVIDDALRDLRGALSAKNIQVRKEYSGLPPCSIDPRRMRSVFRNLLENAIESLGQRGCIKLAAAPFVRNGTPMMRVEFADDGRGMSAEEMRRAFVPFFSTKEGGTGMGLAIARKIARLHCGDIAMASARGKGTRVSVTFRTKTE